MGIRPSMLAAILSGAYIAPPAGVNIFNGAIPASGVSNEPGTHYTLGLRFQCLVDGEVTGLRFYKTKENLSTSRDFGLWEVNISSGSITATLASDTSSGEPVDAVTDPGWIDIHFASPISITTGIDYVIGIRNGDIDSDGVQASYAYEAERFLTDQENASLTLIAGRYTSGVGSNFVGNGLFQDSTTDLTAPPNSFNSTWYGVDVTFVPS